MLLLVLQFLDPGNNPRLQEARRRQHGALNVNVVGAGNRRRRFAVLRSARAGLLLMAPPCGPLGESSPCVLICQIPDTKPLRLARQAQLAGHHLHSLNDEGDVLIQLHTQRLRPLDDIFPVH